MPTKICLVAGRTKPLDRAKALQCAILNQLATPGLGSWLGGRVTVGIAQITLALAGFGFVVVWLLAVLRQFARALEDPATEPKSWPWLGLSGAVLFGLAWLWAGCTSVSLWREARRNGAHPAE